MWLKTDDPWLGVDRYEHWLGGTVAGAACAIVLTLQPMTVVPTRVFIWSELFVAALAIGKEIWDHFHPPHTSSLQDMLTTIGGGVPGVLAGMEIAALIAGATS